ncbi:MAG: hypothetical protein ACERLM_03300 [Acidimicrobiales bacterium]
MNIDGTGKRIVADGSGERRSFNVARWVTSDWVVGSQSRPWKGHQLVAYRVNNPLEKLVVWTGDVQAGGRNPILLPG